MSAPPMAAGPPPMAAPAPFAAPLPVPAPTLQPVSNGGGAVAASSAAAPPEAKRALRKLSPEDKAQRRLRRNLIVAGMGLAILLLALAILLQFSG